MYAQLVLSSVCEPFLRTDPLLGEVSPALNCGVSDANVVVSACLGLGGTGPVKLEGLARSCKPL